MVTIKIIRKLINFFDSFQQKKIIKFFKKKFQHPIVLIDVGAHNGETVKLFRSNFKINKIYSFEASLNNFKILEKNIEKFKLNNFVNIYNLAIGQKDEKGFLNETIESSSSTINSINLKSNYFKRKLKILNIKPNENFYQKTPIKIITLDHFISSNEISKIDILKIDTEGYELSVLKGVKLNYNIIKYVYFEHHYDDMIIKNYKFSDINNVLNLYGFKKVAKYKMIFRKSFEYIYENQTIVQ
tara:strand:+ start:107 stop:832 length:726 start_codon:yes stop_codon:yes gene_type:complete